MAGNALTSFLGGFVNALGQNAIAGLQEQQQTELTREMEQVKIMEMLGKQVNPNDPGSLTAFASYLNQYMQNLGKGGKKAKQGRESAFSGLLGAKTTSTVPASGPSGYQVLGKTQPQATVPTGTDLTTVGRARTVTPHTATRSIFATPQDIGEYELATKGPLEKFKADEIAQRQIAVQSLIEARQERIARIRAEISENKGGPVGQKYRDLVRMYTEAGDPDPATHARQVVQEGLDLAGQKFAESQMRNEQKWQLAQQDFDLRRERVQLQWSQLAESKIKDGIRVNLRALDSERNAAEKEKEKALDRYKSAIASLNRAIGVPSTDLNRQTYIDQANSELRNAEKDFNDANWKLTQAQTKLNDYTQQVENAASKSGFIGPKVPNKKAATYAPPNLTGAFPASKISVAAKEAGMSVTDFRKALTDKGISIDESK